MTEKLGYGGRPKYTGEYKEGAKARPLWSVKLMVMAEAAHRLTLEVTIGGDTFESACPSAARDALEILSNHYSTQLAKTEYRFHPRASGKRYADFRNPSQEDDPTLVHRADYAKMMEGGVTHLQHQEAQLRKKVFDLKRDVCFFKGLYQELVDKKTYDQEMRSRRYGPARYSTAVRSSHPLVRDCRGWVRMVRPRLVEDLSFNALPTQEPSRGPSEEPSVEQEEDGDNSSSASEVGPEAVEAEPSV
uniref:Uncharacterized protein n=1 Tax=Leersia perrieri TaxID=77586 RepID=A0A0D9X5B6_9ORYZ